MKATWIIQEPSVILIPKPNKDNTTENYNSVAFMKGPLPESKPKQNDEQQVFSNIRRVQCLKICHLSDINKVEKS